MRKCCLSLSTHRGNHCDKASATDRTLCVRDIARFFTGVQGLKGGVVRAGLVAVVIALLAVPAVRALFLPGYLNTYDGMTHLVRLSGLDAQVRAGVLYPRWMPESSQGHGLLLFNFYPPLGFFLAEIPVLAGLPVAQAMQLALAVSVVVSGWGMYLFARQLGAGRIAAVISAAAYMYFPYHLGDIYSRGGVGEVWSMSFLPWLATALALFSKRPTVGSLAFSALAGAAVITAHNVTGLFALPIIGCWAIVCPPFERSWRPVIRVAGGIAAGLVLSSIYWLPAVGELGISHANLYLSLGVTGTRDLAGLVKQRFFAPYGDQSYQLAIPEVSVLIVLLLACGLAAWLRPGWRRRSATAAVFAGLLIAAIVAGQSNNAVAIWNVLPLAKFMQFPWRLLAFVGFSGAALIGLVGASDRRWSPLLLVLAGVLATSSLGELPWVRFDVAGGTLTSAERATYDFGRAAGGGLIEGEYVPATSSLDTLNGGRGVSPAGDSTQAGPLAVRVVSHVATHWELDVVARQSTVLRLQQFYFPGWAVRMDGRSAPIEPATGAGLLETRVPAGSHKVEIDYGDTLIERAATYLTIATALLLLFLLARTRPWLVAPGVLIFGAGLYLHFHIPASQLQPLSWAASSDQQLLGRQALSADGRVVHTQLLWLQSPTSGQALPDEAKFDFVLTTSGGAEVERWTSSQAHDLFNEYVAVNEVLERSYSLALNADVAPGVYDLKLAGADSDVSLGSVPVSSPPVPEKRIDVPFEDVAVLQSYQVRPVSPDVFGAHEPDAGPADATLYPGDFLDTTLNWLPVHRPSVNDVGFVHLLDTSGKTWAQHDNEPNATLQPTSSWVPGQPVFDHYLLKLDDSTPPGLYRLEVGLYRLTSDFIFVKVNGGNSALFGSIKVKPRTPPPLPAVDAPTWQEPIVLNGWQQSKRDLNLALTFNWAATGTVGGRYTAFVQLLDAAGKVPFQADGPPQDGLFPTDLWEAGDRITDVHLVRNPSPGRYRLVIGWYDPKSGRRVPLKTGSDSLDLGEVNI